MIVLTARRLLAWIAGLVLVAGAPPFATAQRAPDVSATPSPTAPASASDATDGTPRATDSSASDPSASDPTASDRDGAAQRASIVVDDFESYAVGTFPDEWVYVTRSREVKTHEEVESPGEEVVVREEEDNRFVRLMAVDDVVRYTKRNDADFDWTVQKRPVVRWRWRALELPEGASERGENDTGAALYVTFGTDWLGRPISINYTYSSALPVGTTVGFGSLQVVVVDSRPDSGVGTWQTVRRNVVRDYRRLFDEAPPARPAGITIWSDTDTTHGRARVDVDDIVLLPEGGSPSRRTSGSRTSGSRTSGSEPSGSETPDAP